MTKVVTGIFHTSIAAREALLKLENAGFTADHINVVAADNTIGRTLGIEKDSKAAEGGTIGATSGGIIGAIAAGLLSTAAITIPGLNLVVFGTLIAAVAGAGAGAAVGGLAGALIGLGIPEYEVKELEESVKKGSVLIAVDANDSDRAAIVKSIFKQSNAQNIAA